MKRKLLFVCTMLLALCLAAGGVSAFAAVREDTISDAVLTESGAINILDWEQVGEKTAFTPVVTNRYAASGASTTTVVYYGELLNLADGTDRKSVV